MWRRAKGEENNCTWGLDIVPTVRLGTRLARVVDHLAYARVTVSSGSLPALETPLFRTLLNEACC